MAALAPNSPKVCKVCYVDKQSEQFISFTKCGHSFCKDCAKYVFEMNITESKTDLQCLRCSSEVLPYEVNSIVSDRHFQKYLDFSLRKYLAHIPTARYCPAPDCTYAYILENVSGCDDGHFVCVREGCRKEFCYECKRLWHPEKTCLQAKAEVAIDMPDDTLPDDVLNTMNAKQCPVCHATIEKMADGSCNQVHCVCCGIDFCWLCGKRITEMHYLSPTGCPLYGQQQWSTKKLWCCRIGMWLLSPFFILLIALLAIPLIFILIPIGVGYKVYSSTNKSRSKRCRIGSTVVAVIISLLFAPLIALIGALALIPLGCCYVYGVIPVHLCWTSTHSELY